MIDLALRKWLRQQRKRQIKSNLRKYFKITIADYMELFRKQQGRCAICKRPEIFGRLVVDHDPACCSTRFSCGQCVRGLLCFSCNLALGHFKDNPAVLQEAIAYLQTYRIRATIA